MVLLLLLLRSADTSEHFDDDACAVVNSWRTRLERVVTPMQRCRRRSALSALRDR